MRRRETTGGWRRRSCRFLVLMGLVTILLSPERAGADEVELFLRGAWIEVTSEDAIRFDRSGQRLPVRFRGRVSGRPSGSTFRSGETSGES